MLLFASGSGFSPVKTFYIRAKGKKMSRLKIAAGNWKMNTTLDEGAQLAYAIAQGVVSEDVEVVISPPATHLSVVGAKIKGSGVALGVQNAWYEDSGAYTGEVSPAVLSALGVKYLIIGHSERREYFQEGSDILNKKIQAAFRHNLKPIFCCGEPLEVRESGEERDYVRKQIEETLFKLPENQFTQVVIAYEPIWAIGTGRTATPEQAQEMHKFIRDLISKHFNEDIAENVSILYGGSVKPDNADELFARDDVDGALVGGASLKAEDFMRIINSLAKS